MESGDKDGSTYQVTFLPRGERVEVPKGGTVLEAAVEHDIDVISGCGGAGACALCEVWVREDPQPPRARLACEIEVDRDLIVEIR